MSRNFYILRRPQPTPQCDSYISRLGPSLTQRSLLCAFAARLGLWLPTKLPAKTDQTVQMSTDWSESVSCAQAMSGPIVKSNNNTIIFLTWTGAQKTNKMHVCTAKIQIIPEIHPVFAFRLNKICVLNSDPDPESLKLVGLLATGGAGKLNYIKDVDQGVRAAAPKAPPPWIWACNYP